MHYLTEIIGNRLLWAALLGWFIAQSLKIPTYYFTEKKLDFSRFFESGGMPSSHTAMTTSLMLSSGCIAGFDSPVFAVSFVLMMIVMYDAAGVRRETGKQSQVINEILRHILVDGEPITEDNFRELIGHKPIEVTVGFIIGIVAACIVLAIG